jgi:hypothetical protein
MSKSKKCTICNKKIKNTLYDIMRCKCEAYVCSKHRYPDQHNCTYDFKTENKAKLTKELPLVECDKVIRI